MSITRSQKRVWTSEFSMEGYDHRVVRLEEGVYAITTGELWDIVYLHPPDRAFDTMARRVVRTEPHTDWWVTASRRLNSREERTLVAVLETRFPKDFQEADQ